jgi:hypothetical protein
VAVVDSGHEVNKGEADDKMSGTVIKGHEGGVQGYEFDWPARTEI